METGSPGSRTLEGWKQSPRADGRAVGAGVGAGGVGVNQKHGQVNAERFGVGLEDALVGLAPTGNQEVFHRALIQIQAGREADGALRLVNPHLAQLINARTDLADRHV